MVNLENVDEVFTHHAPKTDFVKEKYSRIRQAAKELARAILSDPVHAPIRGDTGKPDVNWTSYSEWIYLHWSALQHLVKLEVGECGDRFRAIQSFQAAWDSVTETDVPNDTEKQMAIMFVRQGVMWANAAVALQAKF